MDDKRKPYLTISVRKPRFSSAMVAIVLLVAAVAGTLGIQEYQRWQKQLLDTETRLQETEEKLLETESELLEAQGKLEGYLLVSPLSEPIAFMSTSWGIDAIACTQMPLGYRAWGNTAATGRLLFYFTTEWDSVESIDQSDQYWLVGKDEWGARWKLPILMRKKSLKATAIICA